MLETKESKTDFIFQFGFYGKLHKLKPTIYLEIHRWAHENIRETANGQKLKGNDKLEQEAYKILMATALFEDGGRSNKEMLRRMCWHQKAMGFFLTPMKGCMYVNRRITAWPRESGAWKVRGDCGCCPLATPALSGRALLCGQLCLPWGHDPSVLITQESTSCFTHFLRSHSHHPIILHFCR